MTSKRTRDLWTPAGRATVFVLASSSIACLLLEFYGICPMRLFARFVFLPAMVALIGLVGADLYGGQGRLGRAVLIGLASGLTAAVAYDIFRLPFVYAKPLGMASIIRPMDLFKVFPGFGAMILGEPIEQTHYSGAAELLGWMYHFSNGATFGIMYLAMIGDARRRHWLWAVVMAVGLELGMLLSPYPKVFHIAVTTRFIWVTMAAHSIFGVGMGLIARTLAGRELKGAWNGKPPPALRQSC